MKKLFALFLLNLLVASSMQAAKEIYAVFSTDSKTMTLYYDESRTARSGFTDWTKDAPTNVMTVQTVTLDASMKDARPASTENWFTFGLNITKIKNLNYLNTQNVTSMKAMFGYCTKLETLDVSTFDTRKVTDMNSMFYNCEKLTSLDLTNFEMHKVNSTANMFFGCAGLTTIICKNDWTKFVVTQSENMFAYCAKLKGTFGTACDGKKNIDISYARPDNGTAAPGYFTIPLTDKPEIYAVLDGSTTTFYYDRRKEERNGYAYWDLAWSSEKAQFPYNTKKIVFDSSMDKARPTSTREWFSGFEKLEKITGMQYLHTDAVTDMTEMFANCKMIKEIDVTGFNTSKVTSMEAMFMYCSNLVTIDLCSFDVSKVKNISRLFAFDYTLTTIFCTQDWTEYSFDYASYMFMECSNLVGGKKTKYDVSHIGIEYARTDGGDALPGYFTNPNIHFFGPDITWWVEKDVLHIDGKGDMPKVDYEDIPWNSYNHSVLLIQFESPDITSICDNAFYRFDHILFVKYPDNCGITKIGKKAFSNCELLQEIEIPENVTLLGEYCFFYCKKAYKLTLPDNITAIPDHAFEYCETLTDIVLHDNITELGESCFFSCGSLTNLVLSNSLTAIPNAAFKWCSELKEINLPNSITTLGEECFSYCDNVTKLYLSPNLKQVDDYAFYNCPIEQVSCPPFIPPVLGTEVFADLSSNAVLNVYRFLIPDYAETTWADYFTIEGGLGGWKVTVASSDESLGTVSIGFDPEDIILEKDGDFFVRDNATAHLIATPAGDKTEFVQWNDDNEGFDLAERNITVTKDFDFIAAFQVKETYFTVTFLDWDATVLLVEKVEEGQDAVGPDSEPVREGYTFIGWSKPATNITADLTVIAQYEKKTETDLNDLPTDNLTGKKVINNGTLYILRNGNTYTLQGQHM